MNFIATTANNSEIGNQDKHSSDEGKGQKRCIVTNIPLGKGRTTPDDVNLGAQKKPHNKSGLVAHTAPKNKGGPVEKQTNRPDNSLHRAWGEERVTYHQDMDVPGGVPVRSPKYQNRVKNVSMYMCSDGEMFPSASSADDHERKICVSNIVSAGVEDGATLPESVEELRKILTDFIVNNEDDILKSLDPNYYYDDISD